MKQRRASKPERSTIRSWDDLRRAAPDIVARINADPALALAAGANPLFAIEDLGYTVEAGAKPEIEARLRFGPKRAIRVRRLAEVIAREFGSGLDPLDDVAVAKALSGEKRKGRPRDSKAARPATPGEVDNLLERRRDEHPGARRLLEYRKLARAVPRLASRDAYSAIREGRLQVPLSRLTARFKQSPPGTEDESAG